MDKDFNEFWNAYQPDENRFPRRRAATFRAWNERTPAARKAMLAKVKAEGAPKWKNPYFYVADFPEPEPYNWNGDPRIEAMMRAVQGMDVSSVLRPANKTKKTPTDSRHNRRILSQQLKTIMEYPLYDVPYLVREPNEYRMSEKRHKIEVRNQAVVDDYFMARANGASAHEARRQVAEKHGMTPERVYCIVKWFFNQARKRRKYDFLQKFAPLEEH